MKEENFNYDHAFSNPRVLIYISNNEGTRSPLSVSTTSGVETLLNSEFQQPASQSAGIEPENSCCALRALDPPGGLVKY